MNNITMFNILMNQRTKRIHHFLISNKTKERLANDVFKIFLISNNQPHYRFAFITYTEK